MLLFKFLTALLVPLAASAVPTSSDLSKPNQKPNGLNLNKMAPIATVSQSLPLIVSETVSGLPSQTSSSAEAYKPAASNSSRDNTKVITRRDAVPTPCDCSDLLGACAKQCQKSCSSNNGVVDLGLLSDCLNNSGCCSGGTGNTLVSNLEASAGE